MPTHGRKKWGGRWGGRHTHSHTHTDECFTTQQSLQVPISLKCDWMIPRRIFMIAPPFPIHFPAHQTAFTCLLSYSAMSPASKHSERRKRRREWGGGGSQRSNHLKAKRAAFSRSGGLSEISFGETETIHKGISVPLSGGAV